MKQKNTCIIFQQYETIIYFGYSIFICEITIVETKQNHSNLLNNITEFNNHSRSRLKERKDKKGNTYESAYALYEGRELNLNAFKTGIFPLQLRQGKGLKIFTPKQMLQRLSIALAQVK